MVTLRAYLNLGEALLARSHLEECKIPSELADENAHLYGGAPFAMPIRLLVREEDVERAVRVLKENAVVDVSSGTESEFEYYSEITNPESAGLVEQPEREVTAAKNNPWEILVIALLFLGPGGALLSVKQNFILLPPGYPPSRYYLTILSPAVTHGLGLIAIALGLLFVSLYFYTKHQIKSDGSAARQNPLASDQRR